MWLLWMFAMVPRIQPMTPKQVHTTLQEWMKTVDPERRHEVEKSMSMYDVNTSHNCSIVGVQFDVKVQAVALLDRIADHLLICHIESSDL